MLEGVLDALQSSKAELSKAKGYLEAYKRKFSENFGQYVRGSEIDLARHPAE